MYISKNIWVIRQNKRTTYEGNNVLDEYAATFL